MPTTRPEQALLEHYVKKILAAPVYDLAVRTPLQVASGLSEALGKRLLLKREDLKPTFSFKIRGAYNKLVQLTAELRACGVITASAGNHRSEEHRSELQSLMRITYALFGWTKHTEKKNDTLTT